MTTVDFMDKLLQALDEVVFPALAAYAIYMLKVWMQRPGNDKR